MVSYNPEFNNDQGFVTKKYATKKIVQGPDGKPKIVYVDTTNGRQIANPKGYTVIESSNVVDPVQQQRQTQNQTQNTPTTQGQVIHDSQSSALNEVRGLSDSSKENPNITAAKQTGEKPVTNLGYTNKPMGMGLLGFLPQPFGLMGTGLNLGINAANTEAVNDQREVLGFTKNPTLTNIGSTVMDKKGYIGDQATIDQTGVSRTTPVGFEAEDPVGRTTLTPNEARMREELNPSQFSQASQASIDNARTKFAQENPGWGASLANAAKGLFSNMFGDSSKPASMEGTPGVGSGNPSAFPSRPTAPTKTTTNVDTGRGPAGVDTSGYSPGLW